MERIDILLKMQDVFRDVLDNSNIVLTEETTADDIEEWTSLTHVSLINSIENNMNISFSVREMMGWQNIGEIIDSIQSKL